MFHFWVVVAKKGRTSVVVKRILHGNFGQAYPTIPATTEWRVKPIFENGQVVIETRRGFAEEFTGIAVAPEPGASKGVLKVIQDF